MLSASLNKTFLSLSVTLGGVDGLLPPYAGLLGLTAVGGGHLDEPGSTHHGNLVLAQCDENLLLLVEHGNLRENTTQQNCVTLTLRFGQMFRITISATYQLYQQLYSVFQQNTLKKYTRFRQTFTNKYLYQPLII